MNAVIHPCRLSGAVRVPASKSAAHRALIAAALSDGPTAVYIDALNNDIEATLACLTRLGARIDRDPNGGRLTVTPIGSATSDVVTLDCGESGSTLRFLLPVACALGTKARFTGRGRLPERPNAALTGALRQHGARIDSDALPMNAAGPLSGGAWELPGNVSSQYVTGLLFALPLLHEDSEIRLTSPLQSASYVDMTLNTLRDFGVEIVPTASGWRVPGNQTYRSPGDVRVEGDWSAAAFWLAANAMGANIDVTSVSRPTAQGDSAAADLLGRPEIDATNVPDLVPALAAAAAVLPQRTTITGAARLRLKESDRLKAVADMIGNLGGQVKITADGLIIDGGRPLRGGRVDGMNDHRIVMAAAILAARAGGPVTVSDAQAVSKSYPDFFNHFKALGGIVDVEPAGR